MSVINQRLAALRAKMKEHGIDYYVIPSGDYHGSEYLSACFRVKHFICGFTGSAGTVLVGPREALLWTDGRYFIQAERELAGSEFRLMRMAQSGVPSLDEYLKQEMKEGQVLGFDGRTTTVRLTRLWEKALADKNITLLGNYDLAGAIWQERPAQVFSRPFLLEERYSGLAAGEKIDRVREKLASSGADTLVLSSLDDIAWLLNIRGDDVPNNPVVFGFVILDSKNVTLYCRRENFRGPVGEKLEGQGVILKEYEEIWEDAGRLSPEAVVFFDPAKTVRQLLDKLPAGVQTKTGINPTTLLKCIKNPVEQEALRESHRKDGVAMVKWLYWLMHHEDPESLTEIEAETVLEKCRREQGAFGLSFSTIAAMGPNAAMMHYKAAPETTAHLKKEGFFLVDSGGQYLDGTTDITRTIAMGPLTEQQKLHYTATLRSMLRLGAARFLKGSTCYFLDILARGPIWDLNIDYQCGTGHGVGFCLNVHEGPNGFRWSKPTELAGLVELEPGMVTTDEPGVYIEGEYGIRIENELLCVAGEENAYGQFLGFEHLTLCPIDLKPLIPEMLGPDEKKALNDYHALVYERLKSGLTEEEAAWLKEITAPV